MRTKNNEEKPCGVIYDSNRNYPSDVEDYVKNVRSGIITFDQIPPKYRETVRNIVTST